MNGYYHKSQPASAAEFRERTANHKKMAGVALARFTCAGCHESKPCAGRKQVVPGVRSSGYLCTDCQTTPMECYGGHQRAGCDYSLALRDMLRVIIATAPMTSYDIARKATRAHSTVITVVKKLRKAGLIHIVGWKKTPGRTGPMEAMYLWGSGIDAKKPKPDTAAERRQKYSNCAIVSHHSQLVMRDPLMAALFGPR